MHKKILCLDFDGVIHSYDSGWHGAGIANDPPVPGAMEFIRKATRYFDVQIFSSRSNQEGGIQAMVDYISLHMTNYLLDIGREKPLNDTRNIMVQLGFPKEKPPAFLTIDDRALLFTGVFPEHVEELLEFKPWNKKEV